MNPEATGTSGGILILADPSCCLMDLEHYDHQGCGYHAFLWQATEATILVIGIYLHHSETLQSTTNATIISRVLALLEATRHPYVIIGDWQNHPDAIAGTVLPAKFHFGILAPDHSVLSGNVLDYGLLHDQLASTTALTTDWAVPWRPHALLTLTFDVEAATREYRQIQQFPALPKVPDIDFRPWTTYQSQAHELCLYDNPTNEAAQHWADWISKTEQYVLQEHPWAAQGRGANLRAITKPLLPIGPTRTWRKGRPAYWEQLRARFQLAIKQPAEAQHGPVKGFMKMIKDVQKHWQGPPTWGQFLDTTYHWHKYRDPHAADLMEHTMTHQHKEAQQQANDESMLQYQEWLLTGQQKGLKGLFRSLKTSEMAWLRPYRQIPMHDRMTQRLQDWGDLWGLRPDNDPHPRQSLQQEAQAHAATLEPITVGQLSRVLKGLPDKASGPDAVSTQLLKAAPPLALAPLLNLIRTMEEQAQLPTQMQMHMVVMLPKNATIERPITLTSTLWRTWCRLRKPVLDQWQKSLPMTMEHDKARPGANVLFVALERLLRQEVHRARGNHGITVLMDMSTFYDTIPLDKLQQEAMKLNYPPLHLELAMQLYTGPKAISAEQEFTPFFRVDRGIPAGCPQAPLLAKAVLAPALIPWREDHPDIHLTSWVDDIGYDTHGRSPLQVATRAVEAYRDLHARLQHLGLRVNAKKTAFLATDKATDRELKALLKPHEPQVATVMRDLGIDHQAARRRRIPVLKQRFAKAHHRKLKLRSLKIPSLKVRLRLHKGGIQPVALWGIEAQGLAPRYRLALRTALANQLGHHQGGSLDATFDLHSNKYLDPADQVIIHHIKAIHTLYQAWPTDQIEHLEQAWSNIYQHLSTKAHPWYTVKGPIAATIAYLLEWQWQAPSLHQWTRPETAYLTENALSLRQPWWQLEKKLLKEATSQRTARLAQKQYHQHLVAGLDWHVFRQLVNKLPKEHRTCLRTWVQGAIHYRENGKPKPCPVCAVPATPKHIVWMCKWHKGKGHKPMPPEWAERLTQHDEDPLWNAGWIPLEPQDQLTQHHPYQGHGVWQGLQMLQAHQHQGWAFTLDATPSTYDTRSQLWVFGLCVHVMRTGQLQRLGAITGVPDSPQTKTRALLAGLVALAKHTSIAVKVIVQVAAVWEAWTDIRHRAQHQDLYQGLTDSDFHRVTVLYISRNTRTPDTPGSEPHLRRRQRDAALTAWERATQLQNKRATDWQHTLDQDHETIYTHAAARLAAVYQDKEHHLHQKPNRHQGRHTKQHKKQLVKLCTKAWQAPMHRWQPHRSGYQCSACGIRVHQALTASTIEERIQQPCPQIQLDEAHPDMHSPHKPIHRKATRAQLIASLLEKQAQQQSDSAHTLEETKGYLRCTTCGQSIHKRTNEDQGPCVNQPFEQDHSGHATHLLWQRGDRIHCKHCGTQTHTDAQGRPIATATLQKACKGAPIAASPPLSEFFKRQTPAATTPGKPDTKPGGSTAQGSGTTSKTQAGHDTQPTMGYLASAPSQTNLSPLVPRQLQYSAATRQAEAPMASHNRDSCGDTGHEPQPESQAPWQMPHAPQALLPHAAKRGRSCSSASFGEDTESGTDDPVLDVDYF